MANCISCDKKMGFFDGDLTNRCSDCIKNEVWPAGHEKQIQQQKRLKEAELAETILLTTETAPNLNIIKRLDVVSAQAAFEINNFKDLFVGFMNPAEGRSNELEKQLDGLRTKSTRNLKVKAYEIGANAIVAVDLDLSTVTIGGISMMMMASGTAVVIGETDSVSQT